MACSGGEARPRPGASAFTLLEVLLALSLAVLIVILAGSIYTTTTRILAGQEQRQRGRHAGMRALETLGRDLSGALPHMRAGGCAFELGETAGAPGFSAFRFCTASVPPGEVEARWYQVRDVAYRVDAGPDRTWQLLRLEQAREGREAFTPAVTNVLMRGLTGFRVSFRHRDTWQDTWSEKQFKDTPTAARLILHYGEHKDEMLQTEVLIPAGHVVPSTLKRSVQP